MRQKREPVLFTRGWPVALMLLVSVGWGCAAMRHAQQVNTATSSFLTAWQVNNFDAMHDQLHPAFQLNFPRESFIAAHRNIYEVVGRLERVEREPIIPGWKPPLLNERMFADPLPTESEEVLDKYHLYFERSEGYAVLGFGRHGEDVKVVRFSFWLPEAGQPPLVDTK